MKTKSIVDEIVDETENKISNKLTNEPFEASRADVGIEENEEFKVKFNAI